MENEVRKVPELRFHGFDGDWKFSKFIKLTSVLRCGIAATPDYVENGVPFLSAQNVSREGKVSSQSVW